MADDDIHSIPYQVGRMLAAPDPTERTIQQLQREIQQSREITNAHFDGQIISLTARLAVIDKALEQVDTVSEQRAERLDREIASSSVAVRELMFEKFAAIEGRFVERDERVKQTSEASSIALKAALDSAKEAVGKTESAVTKQIDQIYAQMGSNTLRDQDKFEDLKTRISLNETRIQAAESIKLGASEIKQDTRSSSTLVVAVISVAVAVIVAAFSFMHSSAPVALPQIIQAQPIVPHQ